MPSAAGLESYAKILRKGDTLVLPASSDLFRYLTQNSRTAEAATGAAAR